MKANDEMSLGLTARAKNLLRAIDRQDRLETSQEFAGWLQGAVAEGELDEVATELLLRALRVAGDPTNYSILKQLEPLEGVRLSDLMRATGLARVAASERVNDLVQVGLASRELIGDQIRGTPLAGGIVTLVGDVARAAGGRLADELGNAAAGDEEREGHD